MSTKVLKNRMRSVDDLNEKTCYFCEQEFGFNEWKTYVRKATRPKGFYKRMILIGFACEDCADKHECTEDKWNGTRI